LCCLFFFDIWILITPLVSSGTHRINLVTNPVISHVYTENMVELFRQC
jgi:hypothetical protein